MPDRRAWPSHIPGQSDSSRRLLLHAAVVVTSCCLAGCGGEGKTTRETTVTRGAASSTGASDDAYVPLLTRQPKSPPQFRVTTNARATGGGVKSRFTCAGHNSRPRIAWGRVPANTKELLVFVRTLQTGPPTLNWAIAGLSPSVHRLGEGALPAGAVVGRNSFGRIGYYLCPDTRARPAIVSITVVAAPRRRSLGTGFNAVALLDESTRITARDGSAVMVVGKTAP
jgi:phosphatidylethanolamine-binding protein (PEBP) family uncharacterized protein